LDEASAVIERRIFRPNLLHDVPPLLPVVVARVVLPLFDSEHLKFILIPAAYDVQSEAPFAYMRNGDHLFGGKDGMNQRRMHGSKDGDVLCLRQKPAGPSDRLQRHPLEIGFASIALPAR